MGVAGSGKTVIGALFAASIGVDFVEGDDFHSARNIERMATGVPLTDDDRREWLRALAMRIRRAKHSSKGLVMSCSALKRSYRDILRAEADDLQFIFLRGSPPLITERLASRGSSHFMPASLLESQFAELQEPSPDETAWVCDITKSPEEIVASLVARVSKSILEVT